MKKIISGFLLISILTVLLTACDSNVENFQTSQEVQTTEATITQTTTVQAATATTREAAEQTTQSEQNPQYANGELTEKLGKEINELFEGGTYYFKEVTDNFLEEDSDLNVTVWVKDIDKYCRLNYNSVDGENNDAGNRFLGIDNVAYNVDDTKKQIRRIIGKSSLFDGWWVKQAYMEQFKVKYDKTSFIEEDGKQLTCETFYREDDSKSNYYYEGEKLKRFELEINGTICYSTAIEYSKEIDKSVFELPKDYEIVDVDEESFFIN